MDYLEWNPNLGASVRAKVEAYLENTTIPLEEIDTDDFDDYIDYFNRQCDKCGLTDDHSIECPKHNENT